MAGLVQIPYIERNVMAQTGGDLMSKYEETSTGGLAKIHSEEAET